MHCDHFDVRPFGVSGEFSEIRVPGPEFADAVVAPASSRLNPGGPSVLVSSIPNQIRVWYTETPVTRFKSAEAGVSASAERENRKLPAAVLPATGIAAEISDTPPKSVVGPAPFCTRRHAAAADRRGNNCEQPTRITGAATGVIHAGAFVGRNQRRQAWARVGAFAVASGRCAVMAASLVCGAPLDPNCFAKKRRIIPPEPPRIFDTLVSRIVRSGRPVAAIPQSRS